MLSPQPRPTGLTVTTIQFPSPHPTLFAVAGATTPNGAPHVTTAGRPQEQPRWNQTLLFLGEESSLFTVKSACVVEYYPAALGKISSATGTLQKCMHSERALVVHVLRVSKFP